MRPSLAQRAEGVVHITGHSAPPSITDDLPYHGCCIGEAMRGPTGCTCWEAVYDLEQQPLENGGVPPERIPTRTTCCVDCAYRKGSPEREDEHEEEALFDLGRTPGREFWCHQGVRRAVAYRHPSGAEVPAGDGDYQPPVGPNDGSARSVIWRADGSVGERCAGWAAISGVRECDRR